MALHYMYSDKYVRLLKLNKLPLLLYICHITFHSLIHRVVFSTARDGHIPGMFSGVHNTFMTPMPAILLQVDNN